MTITFDLETIESAMEDYIGFCISCGDEHGQCEPDAHEYTCEQCKTPTVYGAEELIIMGLVK